MWTPRREMNRRSTDCLLRPSASDQHKKRWMGGNVLLGMNSSRRVLGRRLTHPCCCCCNKVFNTANASTCFSLFSVSGMFLGARVGRGGAIYQNVSPLVSANGRRPTPIFRTTLAAGREGGREGRVPLSELRMQVTHRPTDGQARNVFSATSFLRTTD